MLSNILNDNTGFFYMMFRLENRPFKPYDYQDLIHNDPHRFKIFRSANQTGKSLILDGGAAKNLITDHGKGFIHGIVSKTLPQSTFQMRRIKSLLNSMPHLRWKDIKGDSDSLSVISFDVKDRKGETKYTNMLICAPCTEGLLGYPFDQLDLDEFEFWTDVDLEYFYTQIAQPRTYATKGGITIFSNPNGMDNYVAKLEEQHTLNGDKKWHTYVFNYLDKPGNTQEEYDQLKSELSRKVFESTVAAIRSLSDRSFFTSEEIERSFSPTLRELDMVNQVPFFFLDVGSKHDRSVLVGGYVTVDEYKDNVCHIHIPIIHEYPEGYPISRVVGSYDKTQDGDGWHVEKSVKQYLEEWSFGGTLPTFGVDVTGNSGISPLFESVGITPEDINFSGPAKSGMYQRFKYFMEKGLLHRIKHKSWESQAAKLVAVKSLRGHLMINAQSHSVKGGKSEDAKLKRIPDDCMDSTAGLILLADNPYAVEPSVVMF